MAKQEPATRILRQLRRLGAVLVCWLVPLGGATAGDLTLLYRSAAATGRPAPPVRELRVEYSRIYAVMSAARPDLGARSGPVIRRRPARAATVDLVTTPGELRFDLAKTGTPRTLLKLALPDAGSMREIRVAVERARATLANGDEVFLDVDDELYRRGFALARFPDPISPADEPKTLVSVVIDFSKWLDTDDETGASRLVAGRSVLDRLRHYRSLPEEPTQDVRVTYDLKVPPAWRGLETLEIAVNRVVIQHAETDAGCGFDDPAMVSFLADRVGEPAYPGSGLYLVDEPVRFVLEPGRREIPLSIPGLDRLPNGLILDVRLLVQEVVATIDGRDQSVRVPRSVATDGLRLVPTSNFVPVCEGYISAMHLPVDVGGLLGAEPRSASLSGRAAARLMAPRAILPRRGGHLRVPDRVWVRVPPDAVDRPVVLRLRQVDIGQYNSDDPLFRRLMMPVGFAYDIEPDAMRFRRPIEIALKLPHHGFGNHNTALYTYSPTPTGGFWTPDVPLLDPDHDRLALAELQRVVAAKEASDDLATHFPPDFSHIPIASYGDLDIERINNRESGGYLVTGTNHLCIKTLFADLNVTTHDWDYAPLLWGALDDLCQTDLVGWVRPSNEDVHCGGAAASLDDLERATWKTRRIIDDNGVALRFRNNLRNYFDDFTCTGPGNYCYDLEDFEDDVRWAVEIWREAINRDPDGGYIDRFRINCWQLDDDAGGCDGDEIDIGLRDIASPDTIGRTYGKNITIDDVLVDRARLGVARRINLRRTLAHELGHALGLKHWTSPGTMMSYAGRERENVGRINLCSPYSAVQLVGGTSTGLFGSAVSDCEIVESGNHLGTSNVGRQRINRLTCTDVWRIRAQAEPSCRGKWCEIQPLHCELVGEESEYGALELPVFDDGQNQAYFELDFDLRFAHCGATPEFSRLELELFEIDSANQDPVHNEYGQEVAPAAVRVGDHYTAPIHLESRLLTDLVDTTPATVGTIGVFPSFSEYMAARDIDSLGVVLKVYAEADLAEGGVRDEFLAASTGLLRTPVLSPIDAQISLAATEVWRDGAPLGDPLATFGDAISSPDLFPYIDDATRKPNVGKALYVVVPGAEDSVRFSWQAPDLQFACGDLGPARTWVSSIELHRGQWPTIADWDDAGSTVIGLTPLPGSPIVSPAHGDPCLYSSGTFDLDALTVGTEPIVNHVIGGNEIEAWELYRVRFNYEYQHWGVAGDPLCTPETDVCAHPGDCTPTATQPFGARSADFYISILGPTGSIVHPPGVDSLCLLDAERETDIHRNRFALEADVQSIQALDDYLSGEQEYQVQLSARGQVRAVGGGICGDQPYGESWTDIADIGRDGILRLDPEWQNNCNDEAYSVRLLYRHRPVGGGDGDWTEVLLDSMRLRVDHREEKCNDDFDYQVTCTPWTETYPCPWR